jgi:hypothetical protein
MSAAAMFPPTAFCTKVTADSGDPFAKISLAFPAEACADSMVARKKYSEDRIFVS